MDDYIGVNLGKTSDNRPVAEPASSEKEVYYPSFYVHDVKLPEIPEGEFYAKVKLCKRSYSKEYDSEGNVSGSSCEFDVKEMYLPKVEKAEVPGVDSFTIAVEMKEQEKAGNPNGDDY